jgi:hypothetical protein
MSDSPMPGAEITASGIARAALPYRSSVHRGRTGADRRAETASVGGDGGIRISSVNAGP